MTSTLGAKLLSLCSDPSKAHQYKFLLKSNVVQRLDEYKLIDALVEFQDGKQKFNADEFESFCQVKFNIPQEQVSILLDPHLVFTRNPIELSDDGVQKIIDAISVQSAIEDIKKNISDYESNFNAAETLQRIKSRTDELEGELIRRQQLMEVLPDIDSLLEQEQNEDGLIFPPQFADLNAAMRPLMGGDFGIVAARPDAGKTSLIGNFVVSWAAQLAEGVPILWINNEGMSKRIWLRLYQIALGATNDELFIFKKAGILEKKFTEVTGGGRSQIKIYDAHGCDTSTIEAIIKKEKPGVVIYDMIDNIKFAGELNNGGQRTDQVLESMYQWARNLAVLNNHIGIATSQISADGEQMQWPLMSMLKDSKTGKQGASDFIMMMSKSQNSEEVRYISLPKNKLAKQIKCPKAELIFDGRRGRFYKEFVSEQDKHRAVILEATV